MCQSGCEYGVCNMYSSIQRYNVHGVSSMNMQAVTLESTKAGAAE
jgi:hypothetical protein